MFKGSKNSDILLKTIFLTLVLIFIASLLQLTFYKKELAQVNRFSEGISQDHESGVLTTKLKFKA
jgi:uncharacterized membrane protein YvbJ